MNRVSCYILLVFILFMPQKAEAWNWWWGINYLNPFYWCRAHLDLADEDELALLEECQIPSENIDENLQAMLNDPAFRLSSMPSELQQLLTSESITSNSLEPLIRDDRTLTQSINQLLREASFACLAPELRHHTLLRAEGTVVCFLGGAINRVAAYSGLVLLCGLLMIPPPYSQILAGTITLCALISSNMLAVAGTNTLRYVGYRRSREILIAAVALAATCIDNGMAYRGITDLSLILFGFDSPLLGVISLYFMSKGLFPLLSDKVEKLPFMIRGMNPQAERLVESNADMLAQLLHQMQQEQLTMKPDHLQPRLNMYSDLMSADGCHSWGAWVLQQLCLYSPPDRMKNAATELLNSGLLEENDELLTYTEALYQRAVSQRRSTNGKLINSALLLCFTGPALVYVFADSSSLEALIEKSLDEPVQCDSTSDTATYVVLQIGLLAVMAGKCIASAQNGAINIQRLYIWGSGLLSGEGEAIAKKIYALNTLSMVTGLFYSANNVGTMAGNILTSDCMDGNTVALATLPTLAGVGAYGFNAGAGPELLSIPPNLKALYHWLLSCCSHQDAIALAVIKQLKEGSLELPSVNNHEELVSWINDQSPQDEDLSILQNWLSHFEPYDGLVTPQADSLSESSGSGGYLEADILIDTPSFTSLNLPDNLQGVVSAVDSDNIHSVQRKYLLKISRLIKRKNYRVETVAKDGNCLYHAVIAMLKLDIDVETLQSQLRKLLWRLENNSNLSLKEREFIKRMGRQNLRKLVREILSGHHVNADLLHLIALLFDVDITFIQPEGENLTTQLINASAPGAIHFISEDSIEGPVFIHNAINHLLWIAPDTVNFHASDEITPFNSGHNSTYPESGNPGAGQNQTVDILTMEVNTGTIYTLMNLLQ